MGKKPNLLDRLFIYIFRRLWGFYSTDPKVLYRKVPKGQALFTADGFLFWLINYDFHKEKDDK